MNVDNTISDHHAVFAIINIPKIPDRTFKRKVWLYNMADIKHGVNNFQGDVTLNNFDNVTDMWTFFTSKFLELIQLHTLERG